MACPYFMPLEKLENGSWPHPARLPLGAGWSGHCTAPGHEGEVPVRDILEAFCNQGYASNCAWTPEQRCWDAVRFAVCGPRGESNETGRLLRLKYVCERGHRPMAHGELEFDPAQAVWIRSHEDGRIQKMAECFLDTYLKKKS